MERSTPTFLFNFPKRESALAEVFALLLPLLIRVLFAGEREGKVVGVSIRERRRRRVLAHGTVIELGKEVLAKRSDDTPRCSRFSVHESGGNLRVVLFIRVPPVALYSRWRERTRRVARDKMRLAPRREEEYPPLLPLSPRDEERTRQKRRRPPRAFHSWRMKVAFRALTRAPIVRHGYSISTGGEERDTCPIPTLSETHRERDFAVSFSHTARYLIDAAPRNDFRETFEDECSLFFPFIDKVSVFSRG